MSPAREDDLACPCPPVGPVDVVGKTWAVRVVSLLGRYGTGRFGPIRRCRTGVGPATLTATLRALERVGRVHRPVAEGRRDPVRAYALTPFGWVPYERLRPLADGLRGS